MRITAKLAYNQIKTNRQRTMWTVLGIVLSTALITAVCSFAASGSHLLQNIYGRNYAEQVGIRIVSLFFPAAIICFIIIAMAVVVISNAFRVSAGERRAQFGTLKSVGTTRQQIMATVMYESVFLSIIGIPVGVILGLILAFAGVQIGNHYLGELNSLVHLMMSELVIVLDFVISWQAILVAFLISFFTVLFSAWLPARKAAKATAIDSIRRVDEVIMGAKQMHTNPLTYKIFGVEGMLAAKNIKRSKRNMRASIISLTVGIVLFICIGSLKSQCGMLIDYMHSYGKGDVIVDYSSSYDDVANEKTGKEYSVVTAPIDSKTAEEITGKLREYKDAVIYGAGSDKLTYTALIPDSMMTPQIREVVLSDEKVSAYEMETELITVDEQNYTALCEQAGVPAGSVILLNQYIYNDNGNAVTMQPVVFEKQRIQLSKGDGTTKEIIVDGELTPGQIPQELLYHNTGILRLVVPEGMARNYSWTVNTDDVDDFIKFANTIMSEQFPEEKDSSYMEQGFSTRVFNTQDYMNVMNIGVNLAVVFIQSFAILLTLVGLTNVISTMSANVQIRMREFAVLQSIGMTREGIKRMIVFESIICSVKSLLIGIPLAVVLTYFISIPIRSMVPVPYQIPLTIVLFCIAAVFGVTTGTMWISAIRLQNKNIVETITSV